MVLWVSFNLFWREHFKIICLKLDEILHREEHLPFQINLMIIFFSKSNSFDRQEKSSILSLQISFIDMDNFQNYQNFYSFTINSSPDRWNLISNWAEKIVLKTTLSPIKISRGGFLFWPRLSPFINYKLKMRISQTLIHFFLFWGDIEVEEGRSLRKEERRFD